VPTAYSWETLIIARPLHSLAAHRCTFRYGFLLSAPTALLDPELFCSRSLVLLSARCSVNDKGQWQGRQAIPISRAPLTLNPVPLKIAVSLDPQSSCDLIDRSIFFVPVLALLTSRVYKTFWLELLHLAEQASPSPFLRPIG
jgi:hypothetical protein